MTDPRPAAEHLFGEIALRFFFCSRRDLDRALRAQLAARESGMSPTVGDMLVAQGVLTPDQVDAVMRVQSLVDEKGPETLYGRIALKNRMVSPEQIEVAIAHQQRTGSLLRLGEILVKKGFVTWEQHEAVLRVQRRLDRLLEKKRPPASPRRS